MPDLFLRDIDPVRFRAEIAADVVNALLPLLTDSLIKPKCREDMAEWLGIGIATLDRMTSSGEIPSSMCRGRRIYIPERVVAALANVKGDAQ